jgi:murein DD-endopeptidase MepM/ murein hydrolase activator NlpD
MVLSLAVPGLLGLLLSALVPGAAPRSVDTWQWPLDPRPALVRGFEPPPEPWLAGHRGVDLAASLGQPVLAVADGTVTYAGQVAGIGVVVVDHGAVRSTYQPVVAAVRRGATVDSGTVLGAITSVGSHCLPAVCLHLGARRGADYLDPLSLLGPTPVRLLPLNTQSRAPPRHLLADPGPAALRSGAGVGLSIGGP